MTSPDEPITDEASLAAWMTFLLSYARGEFPEHASPPMPSLPPLLEAQLSNPPPPYSAFSSPIYTSTEITSSLARTIRQFYVINRYLPPPRAPLEAKREQCILEYDLYSPAQRANLQSATDIMSAFFPGTICTFSLFHNRIQTHFALSGPPDLIAHYQLTCGLEITSEHSLCGHAVLLDNRTLFIPRVQHDWRYDSNPYKLAGFQSYIGASVSLELDPATSPSLDIRRDSQRPTRVGIGTLNICFITDEHPTLSPEQEKILSHIARMLETQLRATWEGRRRTREVRAREAISTFIEEVLVGGRPIPPPVTPFEVGGKPVKPKLGKRRTSDQVSEDLGRTAQMAADKILEVFPELGSVQVIDLRSIMVLPESSHTETQQYLTTTDSHFPLRCIGSSSSSSSSSPSELPTLPLSSPSLPLAILSFLHSPDIGETFHASTLSSGFEPFLPTNTFVHLAMPFFTDQDPLFLFLVSSSQPHYDFHRGDANIIRTIGSIMRAQAVQTRVVQANAAKTAFLSSISHELRTPMHGVLMGLQLASDASARQEWDQLPQLLQVAESSGRTLQHILNDVLDFGSIDRGTSVASKVTTVDLLQSAISTTMDCARQIEGEGVELVVEYEDRDWEVEIDEAGYHRLLANGLSNAIKFCKNAPITVSLTTSPTLSHLILRIIDGGIGIDPKALSRLYLPFTKQSQFSPGVGLGLYITKSLVKRMRGQLNLTSVLGQGTTFEVQLPVVFKGDPGVRQMRSHPIDRCKVPAERTPSPPTLQSPATPSPTPPPQPPQSLLRILVVDDNEISRRLLLMAIKKSPTPAICEQAHDGHHALSVFASFHPHLVLTDVSMPIMDGIASASRMRGIEKDLDLPRSRIYAITGLGSSDPRMKAEGLKGNAALDGWLIKGQDKLDTIRGILEEVEKYRATVSA